MRLLKKPENNIRLYNGDCLDIMKSLISKNVKVDLIVTDPPYLVSATNGGGTINNIKKLNKSLTDLVRDNITDGYDIETFGNLALQLMNKPNIYFWCNKTQIPAYFDFWVNKHKCKFDIICWHKGNALPTYSNKYLSDTEYCLYFRKGGLCAPQNYEDAKSYYLAPINAKDKKVWKHPTIKPLDIIEKLIRNSSKEGHLILDPFMGSGTTGVACKRLQRKFIGIEIDENYFNIAKERINETSVHI